MVKQIEINIDYILMLVKKYHDIQGQDKEILITIQKAVDASPELRSKKVLIENFIAGMNDIDDVLLEWQEFVIKQRELDLHTIITEEKLKEPETRRFLDNAFREGEIKTTGTDIDKLMPPISRFGGGRVKKKQGIIDKLKQFFEKYFGIGASAKFVSEELDLTLDEAEENNLQTSINVYASLPLAPIAAESGLIYENKASESNVDTDKEDK